MKHVLTASVVLAACCNCVAPHPHASRAAEATALPHGAPAESAAITSEQRNPPRDTSPPGARPNRPRTPADALYVVPDVAGRIDVVRDADGDGLDDLVIARGSRRSRVRALDLVSSKDGALVRRLHDCALATSPPEWDAGGDVDGDGTADLVVGDATFESGTGRVLVVSGASARILLDLRGSAPNERLGTSVAFVGDVDGDGRDDFAVSAIEVDPSFPLHERTVQHWESVTSNGVTTSRVQLDDGTWMDHDEYLRIRSGERSRMPGFVRVISGRDGSETWRVRGASDGLAFGRRLAAVGDLDGDRVTDLVVHSEAGTSTPPVLLSGDDGDEIARLDPRSGPIGDLGDVDGDGVSDLYVDTVDRYGKRLGRVRVCSGASRALLYELPYPDEWSALGTTVGVGDFDGDGCPDIALGDGNFNLLAEHHPGGTAGCEIDVTKLTLLEAARIESKPWCAFGFESGCAIVYSGRTREPIFGVWAPPGSRQGVGLEVAGLGDVDGDGARDLVVTDENRAYVYAGPGRAATTAR